MARKYQLKQRAARQDETRLRIIEAAIALHQTGESSISAIAARAGVERPTVYRHFPDERALLTACTGHYGERHPLPDRQVWDEIAGPIERLRAALTTIYAYHRETAPMMLQAMNGVEASPVLREVLAPWFAYWVDVQDSLLRAWPEEQVKNRALSAAVGLAIDLQTWRTLTNRQGLTDGEAIELVIAMVAAIGTH